MSGWGLTDALASKPKFEARKAFFDASDAAVVVLASDTILLRGTSFETGDAVEYTKSGSSAVTGLTTGTTYYVIRSSGSTIKLATSSSNATAGTAINLTGLGNGTADTLQLVVPTLYGVDKLEQEANKSEVGHGHMGWVKVRTNGARKIAETLVALSKNAITTDAEDVEFEDYLITITTQPAATAEADAGDAIATLASVVATITGGGTITYQWQQSVDGGSTFANINPAGGVFTGADSATLGVNAGMTDTSSSWNNAQFRCVLTASGADDVTSTALTLTVNP